MTHNAAAQSRKPRRRGLLAPFVVLLIVAVGWSLGWLWLRGQTEQRMDATALSLKSRGLRPVVGNPDLQRPSVPHGRQAGQRPGRRAVGLGPEGAAN